MKIRTLYILIFASIALSCSYEFPDNEISGEYTLGSINVENFVALGDDFSAGFMNGALYSVGQDNSIPAILARQINEVKELTFYQPDINSENGLNYYVSDDNSGDLYGKWEYQYNDISSSEPNIALTRGEEIGTFDGDKTLLNNYSVPFLKVPQLFLDNLLENPFYQRYAENTGQSILSDVIIEKSPTFFYAWMGMNDILNYAVNGAVTEEGNSYSEVNYTLVSEFEAGFNQIIDDLLSNDKCKGVVGNIMSINDLPYFYTKPYNFIKLENREKLEAQSVLELNKFNEGVIIHNRSASSENKRPMISFNDNGSTLYPQPVIIEDETLCDAYYSDNTPIPKYRQLVEGEMVLFSLTDEMVHEGYGYKIAVPSEYTLTLGEIEVIESIILQYNTIIYNKVLEYPDRLTLVDIASVVHEIAITGTYDAWEQVQDDTIYYFDGIPIEGTLDLYSIFSLDALHFNSRGSAFVANKFIEALNEKYSVFIPETNINNYKGNVYKIQY